MSPRLRNAAKAIIIHDGYLLTTKNRGAADNVFHLLPGGGQEAGETLIETVQRECWEELGGMIEVGRLAFVREYIGANHEFAEFDSHAHGIDFMFICALLTDAQKLFATAPDTYQIGIEWLPLATLDEYMLYPQALKPLIPDLAATQTPVYLGDVN